MKKNKLKADPAYGFELIGIVARLAEYKMAWLLNRHIHTHLIKAGEETLEFINNQKLIISYYNYYTENSQIRLLKNKSCDGNMQYLLPEIKNFDYLLQIHNFGGAFDTSNILSTLAKISEIQFVTQLEINKLKSKDNLIF